MTASPIDELTKPEYMEDATACEYWDLHAPMLIANGTLTSLTLVSFAILCQAYSDFINAETLPIKRMSFGHYKWLAKSFGLVPVPSKTPQKESVDDELRRDGII